MQIYEVDKLPLSKMKLYEQLYQQTLSEGKYWYILFYHLIVFKTKYFVIIYCRCNKSEK